MDLGVGSDWHAARAQLPALPRIGPWTVETIAMRALGDPDAFVPTDLGLRSATRALALPSAARGADRVFGSLAPVAFLRRAVTLWATGDHAINRLPVERTRRPQ